MRHLHDARAAQPRRWQALSTLLLVPILGAAVLAQANRWYEPYRQGVRAFEQQQWEEAVRLLERAAAVDGRQAANKYVEGTFRTNYFPHYYLGVAYLRLGRFEQAQAALGRAGEGLSRELAGGLEDLRQQVREALAKAQPGGSAGNREFAAALRDADAARTAGRHADALRLYEAARGADPTEYGRQNAETRRTQSARARAADLVSEGQAALATSLRTARARFTEADRLAPGVAGAAAGLAEADRREVEYTEAKAALEREVAAGNLDGARQRLEIARRAHPEQFAADALDARLGGADARVAATVARLFEEARQFADGGRYADADSRYEEVIQRDPSHRAATDALRISRQYGSEVRAARALAAKQDDAGARARFEAARALDGRRFAREGLERELASVGGAPGGVPLAPAALPATRPADILRQALQAMMRGDVDGSITLLQPAVGGASSPDTAPLHAYLGVAYATRGLAAAAEADRARFRDLAREQFRLALAARSDYTLSPRLVSPRIIDLFNAVRDGAR
jgi:tetratricopeptide (TPR) repeat protein